MLERPTAGDPQIVETTKVVTDSLETRGGMNRRSHAWLLALRSEPVESKEAGEAWGEKLA